MAAFVIALFMCCMHLCSSSLSSNTITFDDSKGLGHRFDGIGGLSGGGATSKLLITYPDKQRNEILDFLFKPNFGASLQILKVEIGGDIQSTDGTEASHMHTSWEENYERGYEWWMMKEAKKRNPNIKLYGLPWGFPGWLGQGTEDPFHKPDVAADYIVRWVNAALKKHKLKIDYIGIWNESYKRSKNVIAYIKALRKTLDNRGFNETLIIASDDHWNPFVDDMKKDKDLKKAVHAIGSHYPGTYSNKDAQKFGMPLWSSEDYCQKDDETGGACWARVLNRNYVHGYMTSTIAWNLIASYYTQLPGWDMGLMTAKEPWNGHYLVSPPIWTSAHTTQFTSIGWKYLKHNHGVGTLPKGGTYVALVNPKEDELTIVMETMTFEHSKCVWDWKYNFTVNPQNVTLVLQGKFANVKELNMWFTELRFDGKNSTLFQKKEPLKFKDGTASLFLDLNQMITLSTLTSGNKGSYPDSPPHVDFPLPYSDNFEGYVEYREPNYITPQTGSFEVLHDERNGNGFVRQTVQQTPIPWCNVTTGRAYSIIGDWYWSNISIAVDYRLPLPLVNATDGVFVGVRADKAGCSSAKTGGLFFFALPSKFVLSTDVERKNVIKEGDVTYEPAYWHRIKLSVKGTKATLYLDDKEIYSGTVPASPTSGWAALGTDSYALADFDNLTINYS